MNETVVEVWRLLVEGVRPEHVAAQLSVRFELPPQFDAKTICAELADMACATSVVTTSSTGDGPIPQETVIAGVDGLPLYGGIELTWACNLRCVHCHTTANQ